MTYNVGTTMHLVGWQALDYARQRYIPGGDYSRQRHQRQMIKAIMKKIISAGYVVSPGRVLDLIDALGKTLVFDGRGRKPSEFVYALRNLNPDRITLVGLPGAGVSSGGSYLGESLLPIEAPVLRRLAGGHAARLPGGQPEPAQRRHRRAEPFLD